MVVRRANNRPPTGPRIDGAALARTLNAFQNGAIDADTATRKLAAIGVAGRPAAQLVGAFAPKAKRAPQTDAGTP
jgi:hypothetical protein